MNEGEYNEIVVKLKLIEIRDSHQPIQTRNQMLYIESVGFENYEYPSLPLATDLQRLSRAARIQLANDLGVSKSSTRNKGDVQINKEYYSIKSLKDAPPALVNHTNRLGWLYACDYCGLNIDELDTIIDEYWKLREDGLVREDVHNENPNSPFYRHKEYLSPLLNYFFFKGTGTGLSKIPAEYILDFEDPLMTETWEIFGSEYIDEVWDRLIFSVRAKKGMPKDYPRMRDSVQKRIIERWTKFFQGEHRGSLHVRVK